MAVEIQFSQTYSGAQIQLSSVEVDSKGIQLSHLSGVVVIIIIITITIIIYFDFDVAVTV